METQPRRHSSRRPWYRSRRRRKRVLGWTVLGLVSLSLLVAVVVLRLGGMIPAGDSAPDAYDLRGRDRALIQLPRDDGPHGVPVEWWSYKGLLNTDGGGRYGFHVTAMLLSYVTVETVVQASLVDLQTQRRFLVQQRFPGNPSRAGEGRFEFKLGEWLMAGGDGRDELSLTTGDFSLRLRLVEDGPALLHGGTGRLDISFAGESFYYSRPRMHASGTIEVAGKTRSVQGLAWFDHQWGGAQVAAVGWDWFALQLEDGASLLLYRLFDHDRRPLLFTGTYARDGVSEPLKRGDFDAKPLGEWTSPDTGIRFPVRWQIEVPDKGLRLTLEPLLEASELDGRTTSYRVSWIGPIRVQGTLAGQGFQELTGYNPSVGGHQPPPTKDGKLDRAKTSAIQ